MITYPSTSRSPNVHSCSHFGRHTLAAVCASDSLVVRGCNVSTLTLVRHLHSSCSTELFTDWRAPSSAARRDIHSGTTDSRPCLFLFCDSSALVCLVSATCSPPLRPPPVSPCPSAVSLAKSRRTCSRSWPRWSDDAATDDSSSSTRLASPRHTNTIGMGLKGRSLVCLFSLVRSLVRSSSGSRRRALPGGLQLSCPVDRRSTSEDTHRV